MTVIRRLLCACPKQERVNYYGSTVVSCLFVTVGCTARCTLRAYGNLSGHWLSVSRQISVRTQRITIFKLFKFRCGPGSVVGIATTYGLDGPGIESQGGEIFRTSPDRPWGPPSLLYNGYRVFPGGKVRPGRDANPSPLLVKRSKIEYSYNSTLPKGLRGLWKGESYLPNWGRFMGQTN